MEFHLDASPWSTGDKNSFAYPSVRDRWPLILVQGIEDVERTATLAKDDAVKNEGEKIVSEIKQLLDELRNNERLKPMTEDGLPDIASYNKILEELAYPKWFDVPWLVSECYLYRRLQSPFQRSTHWKEYDIFARTKMAGFRSSRAAVLELAAQYREIVTGFETSHSLEQNSEEVDKAEAVFIEICKICLWGNATDLSLLTNLSHDDLKQVQGSEARKAGENNILVNELPAAFRVLNQARAEGKMVRRVDFILDNAGFELFVDLVLAGYLLSSGLATQIVLHPKTIPWFVSDVVPKDIHDLLDALADPRAFYETPSEEDKKSDRQPVALSEAEVENVKFLSSRWSRFLESKEFVIRPHTFWTEWGSYWNLPSEYPDLFADLKESELAISKGDLNYRKLIADVMWLPTFPFIDALGPLGRGSGIRVLTLRTCKGDAVVGLPEGKDAELKAMAAGSGPYGRWEQGIKDSGLDARRWAWSGRWALLQFSDGKQ